MRVPSAAAEGPGAVKTISVDPGELLSLLLATAIFDEDAMVSSVFSAVFSACSTKADQRLQEQSCRIRAASAYPNSGAAAVPIVIAALLAEDSWDCDALRLAIASEPGQNRSSSVLSSVSSKHRN